MRELARGAGNGFGDHRDFLGRQAKRGRRYTDGRDRALGVIEHGGGDASDALFDLFVIDGIAAVADRLQFILEFGGRSDRARGVALQAVAAQDVVYFAFGEAGKNRFADGGAVDGNPAADPRRHADTAGRLDFFEIQSFPRIEDTEVHGFVDLEDNAFQVSSGALADVEAADGDGAEFE